VNDPGGPEAVEKGIGGVGLGTDVLAVDQFAEIQVRQLLSQGYGVEGIISVPGNFDRTARWSRTFKPLQIVVFPCRSITG
jgi:hypothetical protein